MWLPWEWSLALALALAASATALGKSGRPILRGTAAFAREAAIVAVLYSVWQYAGRLSVTKIDGAVDRGIQLWDLERSWHLPDESSWQAALLPHGWLVKASNIYYAGFHVPTMGVFLVWLFARHRAQYPRWRNALTGLTAVSLVIQLIPVAPPRLVGELNVADTGLLYGQSVYAAFGSTIAGQLQAMPSLHVGWALLVAWATMSVTGSAWRWLGPAHAAATSYVVVVTGNHYWLDGAAAGVILIIVLMIHDLMVRGFASESTPAAQSALVSLR